MAFSFKAIIDEMNIWAPPEYAEEWDNVGLQVGDAAKEISKLLIALSPSEQVIEQAVRGGYDAILTHHPLLFKGIKNVTPKSAEGRKIISLIKHDISIAGFHTNLDIASGGVNDCLAKRLGLKNITHFVPTGVERYYKIVVYVPTEFENTLREAVCAAGCGYIGEYSDCTFAGRGQGTFKPLDGTNPFIGNIGELTFTDEVRLETVVSESKLNHALEAMLAVHPYEEPAYDIFELAKTGKKRSIGRIGYLPEEMSLEEFLRQTKEKLACTQLGYSGDLKAKVRKIALCGGSGCEYLSAAKKMGADVYLSGDAKFHDYQKAAEMGIALVDGGHFATEKFILPEIKAFLEERFGGLTVDIAEEKDFKQVYK